MEFTCLYCNCPALLLLRCNNECHIVLQQGIRDEIYCEIHILCPRCERSSSFAILNFQNNALYTFNDSENETHEQEFEPMDIDDDNEC